MRFDEEILRAVNHQAACDTRTNKTKEELDIIISTVKKEVKSAHYDFSIAESIILNQNGKKRFVKLYSDLYSTESILCQCIKQILDRAFKVRYPNRNKSIRSLFNTLAAVKQMSDFTIVKFDFENYFNYVSTVYVFEKFIKVNLSDRFEIDLIDNFAEKTKYAYAGLRTSNVIAEIVAKHFDEAVKQAFVSRGVIYFERYIDDGILIFNEHIEKSECEKILKQALDTVFYDKTIKTSINCKTRFNDSKFRYMSRRTISINPISSIDYLGYEFYFLLNGNKIAIEYGITQIKRNKYNSRIDDIILCYTNHSHSDYGNLELLRHRIAAFTSREVYLSKRFSTNVWKAKGFISNYGELRYLLGTGLLENDTENFLKNMVVEAFNRASIPIPYFLKGSQGASGYNLHENMKRNKTLLLVENIGYDYNALVKICKQIGINKIDNNGKRRGYGTLVRDYLIKVKVGY